MLSQTWASSVDPWTSKVNNKSTACTSDDRATSAVAACLATQKKKCAEAKEDGTPASRNSEG